MTELRVQTWGEVAPAWRRWRQGFSQQYQEATNLLTRAVDARPGMSILDAACATGDLTVALATAVGPRGHVAAVDLVAEMLEEGHQHALSAGLCNTSFWQADAQALPFSDAVFDGITCRLAIPFFPDAMLALREYRRVLRPRGRVALLVWGSMQRSSLFTARARLLRHSSCQATTALPDPLRFSEPGAVTAVLRAAGFQRIEEVEAAVPFPWPGPPESAWKAMHELQPTIRRLFGGVAPGERERVQERIIADMAPYYDGRQVNFTGSVILGTGVC